MRRQAIEFALGEATALRPLEYSTAFQPGGFSENVTNTS
jgi:hypothetical protein